MIQITNNNNANIIGTNMNQLTRSESEDSSNIQNTALTVATFDANNLQSSLKLPQK